MSSELVKLLELNEITVRIVSDKDSIMANIRLSKFIFSMRLHISSLACVYKIPVISLAYSPKIVEYHRQIGLGECISIDDIGNVNDKSRILAFDNVSLPEEELAPAHEHITQFLNRCCE